MSINKVTITGNLTRDAELRTTQGGMAIAKVGVAVNDRRKNASTGQWEDKANFVDIKIFGRRAEALAQYLVKGTKVAVEGKLSYDSWTDRQSGQNRSKLEVLVDEIEFMSGRSQGQQQTPQQQAQGYESAVQQSMPGTVVVPYSDDDIPF